MVGEDEHDHRYDRAAWKKYRTGPRSDYDSIQRDTRGYPLFVRGTQVSRDWDQFRDEATSDLQTVVSDSVEQQDDIFSAIQVSQPSDLKAATSSPIDVLFSQERGKAVASFYSQLPREIVAEQQTMQTTLAPTIQAQHIPRKAQAVNKSGKDWFIRKASVQLQERERKSPRGTAILQSEGSCSICFAPLPTPLSTGQWEAHRSSIAHQLAANGPIEVRSLGGTPDIKKHKDQQMDKKGGRVLLKPSNLGYSALERMGWRKGMGLGREEWEYGMRLEGKMQRKRVGGTGEVIVISDSEEEDDLELEIGSEEWLERIRAEQLRLAATKPAVPHIEVSVGAGVEPNEEEDAVRRKRPLLEPIAVQLRPDRRGIGRALPVSSRIIDGKTQRPAKTSSGAEREKPRLTNSQKRKLERQKQEEWKELRNSLN